MVSAVSNTSAAATSGVSQSASSAGMISADFQTFLLMLTTQMQNQDPLNPIESSEYAVQLATFSGVEQQVKTNTLLEALGGQMGLMGIGQYAGWVGMEARAAAPAWFDGHTSITLSPSPALGADQAVLVVTDSAGREVDRRPIIVSDDTVNWAGVSAAGDLLDAGLYGFSLESYANGALLSQAQVEVYSRIVEARGGSTGTQLVLNGGATIAVEEVTALREGR
ncbi:flagellar basal body rod modification protein [Candidatus Falkowbacteria bacterium]|nr:flagellar basal body rod modification protein [Candidatus Falkowbacteria bacterium]